VAGIVVGVGAFVSWSRRRFHEVRPAVLGATGLVFLALPLVAVAFARSGTLISSTKEATSSNSTFTWRTTSWSELLATRHSLSDLSFGGASGVSWSRRIGTSVTDASPHDGFIDGYLRFGLPGVLVVVALGLVLWRSRGDIAGRTALTAEATALLLLTQLVFSVTYTLDVVQGLLLGVLVSALAVHEHGGPIPVGERPSIAATGSA
jgi:hypothetical protein